MKSNDKECIHKAARIIAPLIPQGSCIVPVPGRKGYADHTLILANEIRKLTGIPVADILVGKSRMSQYEAKRNGNGLLEKDLGFYRIGAIPNGLEPIALDNVIGTGLSGKAAIHALGKGTVLALAMDDNFHETHQLTPTNIQTQEIDNELQFSRQSRSFLRSF